MTPPLAAGSSRVLAWWWFAAAATVLAASPQASFLAAALPSCLLRRWTGIACLTCGGTRAVVSLAEGDPFAAFVLNPAVTVAAVAFVAGGIAAPLWLALGGRIPELASLSTRSRIALAAALLASWVWVAVGPA